jgi:hypothetical protein
MDKLEEGLYNFVGKELIELAWHNSYPINSAVGLWGFFQAFMDHNFNVNLNDNKREVQLVLKNPIDNFPKFLETSLSYNQILEGWKHQPKSSPHSFYDSICLVYDNLEPLKNNFSRENIERKNQWSDYRNSETRKVRQKMEDVWLPFFIEHHEHMLLPVNGNLPELEKPKIFYEILKKFPLHIYKTASENALFPPACEGIMCGPCAEHLLDLDLVNDLDPEEYYPSKSAMTEFFFGNYLEILSEEKGYPLKYKSENKLKSLIINGIKSFEWGSSLKWKI